MNTFKVISYTFAITAMLAVLYLSYVSQDFEMSNIDLKSKLKQAGYQNYTQLRDDETSSCEKTQKKLTCAIVRYPDSRTAVSETVILQKT